MDESVQGICDKLEQSTTEGLEKVFERKVLSAAEITARKWQPDWAS